MKQYQWIAMLLAAAVATVAAVGCSDDGSQTSSGSGASSGSSSGSGGAGGGSGGAGGGMGGEGGGVGGGGGGQPLVTVPGASFVNGGNVLKSPGYQMVYTLGQSSGVQTAVQSQGYRLEGGLIGVTTTK